MTQDETPGAFLDRLGMDGVKWAAEFRKTALQLGYSDMDEGWLIGWFCNAVMAGYDRAPRADLAPVAAPVQVKKLVWEADPYNEGDYSFFRARAGDYVYEVGQDGRHFWLMNCEASKSANDITTLDAAKAAAQADYEARVLAALEAPDAGVVAELVEALRLADAALSGANMNMAVVEKKVKAAIALIAHNSTEG